MTRRRYALLGWPVKHSVSPPMQEAGFAALGIEAAYELRPVPPEGLGEAVAQLRREGFCGWNVTVPHKEHIIEFVDEVEPEAARGGSVNTVLDCDGRLHGYSTDGYGLTTAIQESFGIEVTDRRIVFLGTGGAARACSVYLALHGVRELTLINRTVSKAEAVAAVLAAAAPACRVSCLALADTDRIATRLQDADVLVQSTSLGLHAGDDMPLPAECLPQGLRVMEMIYRQTAFLRSAIARGCPVADGRGMLLHQGARSLSLWTGRPAPVAAMRTALDAALAARTP